MNGISRAQAFHGPSRPTALLSLKAPKMTEAVKETGSPQVVPIWKMEEQSEVAHISV